jgi:tetratricopeptide (TPR) repeat protein
MTETWHENYEAGKKFFEEDNYAEALVHLEVVLREKDSFADVYNMLGIIYYNANRNEEAVKSLRRALELNPRYTEASLNLSVVYNEMGEDEKAQEAYALAKLSGRHDEESTYLDPYVKGRLANMHADIGNIYKDLGRYDEAMTEYKMALGLRPDFVDIKMNLAVVYRDLKDYARAINILKEAIDLKENFLEGRVQLGLTYYTMDEMDKAKSEWQGVIRKDPAHKLANMYMNLLKGKG